MWGTRYEEALIYGSDISIRVEILSSQCWLPDSVEQNSDVTGHATGDIVITLVILYHHVSSEIQAPEETAP